MPPNDFRYIGKYSSRIHNCGRRHIFLLGGETNARTLKINTFNKTKNPYLKLQVCLRNNPAVVIMFQISTPPKLKCNMLSHITLKYFMQVFISLAKFQNNDFPMGQFWSKFGPIWDHSRNTSKRYKPAAYYQNKHLLIFTPLPSHRKL